MDAVRSQVGKRMQCPACWQIFRIRELQAVESQPVSPPPTPAPEAPATGHPEKLLPDADAAVDRTFLSRRRTEIGETVLVCLAHEQKLNPLVVAPLISGIAGVALRDAKLQLGTGMGILAEGVDAARAKHLVEALAGLGIEAFALPSDAAPGAPSKLPFVCIDAAAESGLHVQVTPEGAARSFPWSAMVAGICTVGELPVVPGTGVEVDRLMPGLLGLGAPVRTSRGRGTIQELSSRLIFREASGNVCVLAVQARRIRYSYLGDRQLTGTRQNFALFLADVMKWAGRAFLPQGFRAAAGGDIANARRVQDATRAANYLRWALCCAIARGLLAPD